MSRSRGLWDGCGMQLAQQRDGAAWGRRRRRGWVVEAVVLSGLGWRPSTSCLWCSLDSASALDSARAPGLVTTRISRLLVPAGDQSGPRGSSKRPFPHPRELRPFLQFKVSPTPSELPADHVAAPPDPTSLVFPPSTTNRCRLSPHALSPRVAVYTPPTLSELLQGSQHESPIWRKEHRPQADPQRRHPECTSCLWQSSVPSPKSLVGHALTIYAG